MAQGELKQKRMVECRNPECREVFRKDRPNQRYHSAECRLKHWLALHPRIGSKAEKQTAHIRKQERITIPVTLGEKSDIKAAIDIIKACQSVDKDNPQPFDGAVQVTKLEAWLDKYASLASEPLEALVVIRRRLPNFQGTLTLGKATRDPEARANA